MQARGKRHIDWKSKILNTKTKKNHMAFWLFSSLSSASTMHHLSPQWSQYKALLACQHSQEITNSSYGTLEYLSFPSEFRS